MTDLRPIDVRRLADQIAQLNRDTVDGSRLYTELDHLYDVLLAFFNQKKEEK